MKCFSAKTPIELLEKVYSANGWTRAVGESRTARVAKKYEVKVDYKRGVYVAKPLSSSNKE